MNAINFFSNTEREYNTEIYFCKNRLDLPIRNFSLSYLDKIILYIETKIEPLRENWDGYGSAAMSEKVILNTIYLLKAIPSDIIELLDKDNITPTPHGTLNLTWEKGEEYVSVEIGTNLMSYFSEFINKDSPYNDRVELPNYREVTSILNKLYAYEKFHFLS